MTNLLFICGKNRWRSPTAEELFAGRPGLQCASAGVSHEAETRVSPELLEWADLVLVMEKQHKAKLTAQFPSALNGKRVVCLNIPDRYPYNDPALIRLLEAKVAPFLPMEARAAAAEDAQDSSES